MSGPERIEFEDRVATQFPVLFMERRHAGVASLNGELASYIHDLERSRASWSPNNEHQYNAGFSTDIDLLEHDVPAIRTIRSMIESAFQAYLASLSAAGLLTIGDLGLADYEMDAIGWAVILRRHEWICPHSHQGGAFAGTYYVRAPEMPFPEGCLEFINPLGSYGSSPAVATSPTIRRMPAEGTMLLFPSHYIHLVYPFDRDAERISLSFTLNAAER